MVWQIEFTKKAQKQLYQLDQTAQSKIKKTVYEKLLVAPKENLIRLSGNLNCFYKFRVGKYRLLCVKQQLLILVVKVGHRKNVY